MKRTTLEQQRINFVRSALRRASMRWKPKNNVLNAAKTERKINPRTGRLKWFYICNICKKEVDKVELDHIKPVVPLDAKKRNWDRFIKNLLCDESGFQAICTSCHGIKTAKEQKRRNKNKDARR